MLKKSRGIVLNFIKYKETSIIARVYTEELGLKSFIVNGVRSSRSRTKTGLFQPLTFLELVLYYKENKDLYRISEVKCTYPFKSIPFDIRKSTTSLFLTEILFKTLREETPDIELFQFLQKSILILDQQEMNAAFHLKFLADFSNNLGIRPLSSEHLLSHSPGLTFSSEEMESLQILLSEEYIPSINKKTRSKILQALLNFYGYHFENIQTLKSLPVLQEILS